MGVEARLLGAGKVLEVQGRPDIDDHAKARLSASGLLFSVNIGCFSL